MCRPRRGLTLDDGLMIWRARDAYRFQKFLGYVALVWVLLDLWTQGRLYPWYLAVPLVAVHAAVVLGTVWAVCWGLRWGLSWLWRTFLAAVRHRTRQRRPHG